MTKTIIYTYEQKQAFMAKVLAGTIPCDGLEGYGTVTHRKDDRNSSKRPCAAAYVKDGRLYVQYRHLPKPRLCRDFNIFDCCITAALKK